jgi:hypothetical protein
MPLSGMETQQEVRDHEFLPEPIKEKNDVEEEKD